VPGSLRRLSSSLPMSRRRHLSHPGTGRLLPSRHDAGAGAIDLATGKNPRTVPNPGTRNLKRRDENIAVADIEPITDVMHEIKTAAAKSRIPGRPR